MLAIESERLQSTVESFKFVGVNFRELWKLIRGNVIWRKRRILVSVRKLTLQNLLSSKMLIRGRELPTNTTKIELTRSQMIPSLRRVGKHVRRTTVKLIFARFAYQTKESATNNSLCRKCILQLKKKATMIVCIVTNHMEIIEF